MKDLITIKHGALFPIFTRITMLFIALMLSGVMLAVPLLGGLIAILIFFPVFIYAFFIINIKFNI